jgi:hypothetical protein
MQEGPFIGIDSSGHMLADSEYIELRVWPRLRPGGRVLGWEK